MTDNNKPLSEDEISQWSKDAYQQATSFLAEKGIIAETVAMEHSRFLAPLVAIWKIKSVQQQWFWTISGELPTDMISEEGATSAREAIKAFSFKWQLDSEKLGANPESAEDSAKFADLLQNRAESLYQLAENDQLWASA